MMLVSVDWGTRSNQRSDNVQDPTGTELDTIVGCARTSTLDQIAGFDAERRDLEAAGAERVYEEQTSSVGHRTALADAMAFCRADDTFTIIDRLARSVTHFWEIVRQLEEKEVALRFPNLDLDTNTPTGRLMLTFMGGAAEFERSMMFERQREGIAKAEAEGRYEGREPTARAKAAEVAALSSKGMSLQAIANEFGIGKASVHRILSKKAA